jgi:hypothetical protein
MAQRMESNWVEECYAANGLERENGSLCAGVIYDHFNRASICMHTVIEFINREFLWYCFYYPFIELKCKKVIGVVPGCNKRALEFDKHLGFVEEARLRDTHPEGDLVFLTMRREDCRYLEIPSVNRKVIAATSA